MRFAKDGYRVIVTDILEDEALNTVKLIRPLT
ncbi:MAG: hypothetical protein ACJA09_001775 [Alcanivorax sp.]|jgi:hypothetical protein